MNNELQLIIDLKKGNKNAFESIYNIYNKRIYLFALGYLKSKEKAECTVQNIFLKLWEKRQEIDENFSINNLLYKITKNNILNQIRTNNYHQKYCNYSKNSSHNNEDNSTFEKVVATDFEYYLNNEIEKMPQKRKAIFLLSRQGNLSSIEIAEKLRISKRTVDNQIYRAIKQLKSALLTEQIKPIIT